MSIHPLHGPVVLETIADATLTTFGTGRIPVAPGFRPDHFVSGAVYDGGGCLVSRSQRVGGLAHDHALSVDPTRLPTKDEEPVELEGSWLYGGTWFNHFGHFLTETVTTLWPQEPVDGVIFHPFWFGRERLPYQLEAMRLLGHVRRPSIVGRLRVRVQELLVPTRPYLPNGSAAPEALDVYDRLREAALPGGEASGGQDGPERVFLSRSRHNEGSAGGRSASRRGVANDAEVDALAARLGFHVVFPEDLSLSEQIVLASGARVLAGPSGSALHLSVFAGADCRVVELGDGRGWGHPVRTQEILCHARGQHLGFISFTDGPQGHRLDRLEEKFATFLDDAD